MRQVRSSLLGDYGTNVLACTSPLGVNVGLPGNEKENLAVCIGLHLVGKAEVALTSSADEEDLELLLGHPTYTPEKRTCFLRFIDQPSRRPPIPLTRPRKGPRPEH